jgi:hypothetical protein
MAIEAHPRPARGCPATQDWPENGIVCNVLSVMTRINIGLERLGAFMTFELKHNRHSSSKQFATEKLPLKSQFCPLALNLCN